MFTNFALLLQSVKIINIFFLIALLDRDTGETSYCSRGTSHLHSVTQEFPFVVRLIDRSANQKARLEAREKGLGILTHSVYFYTARCEMCAHRFLS